MRLLRRFPIDAGKTYMEVRNFCEGELPQDTEVYNRLHGLIVHNGKEYCKKKIVCTGCPLEELFEKILS